MLLSNYTLKVVLPDCNHSATTVNAVAELSDDISAVLPYLNGELKGARYDPRTPSLIFQREGHRIILQPRQAAITKLEDEAEAKRVMEWLVETVNHTWERRNEIEPDYQATRQPTMLEVYRLLPGNNCRACGEVTCLAFAAKLAREEIDLDACTPLFNEENAVARGKLLDLISSSNRSLRV